MHKASQGSQRYQNQKVVSSTLYCYNSVCLLTPMIIKRQPCLASTTLTIIALNFIKRIVFIVGTKLISRPPRFVSALD